MWAACEPMALTQGAAPPPQLLLQAIQDPARCPMSPPGYEQDLVPCECSDGHGWARRGHSGNTLVTHSLLVSLILQMFIARGALFQETVVGRGRRALPRRCPRPGSSL